jgi:acetoin utilization deacetylase AcuC-like enzyme
VKVFHSPRYDIFLPGHIWPTAKYRLIAERLRQSDRAEAFTIVEPSEASWEDLALVHTREYLEKLRFDRLTPEEIATLELPWRPGMADAFRLMTGGTIAAAAAALDEGRAAHVGGGLHHAFANHGEGFCPLNDIAVAIRVLQASSTGSPGAGPAARVRRAAVVDLDVHQGNGTAMIFDGDASVFTFSMHQQHNYPVFKPRSDLDVGLENGTGDDRYLALLASALPRVFASRPELVVYVAGADPFGGDRLGGLALTKAGLAERDRLVLDAARTAHVPLVTVLAGGYAADVTDTVDVHVATIRAMLD